MQITVTEENDWEGETFSYVMEVTEQMADAIEEFVKPDESMKFERNTTYTKESIAEINKHSNNSYLQRIGFYELENEEVEKKLLTRTCDKDDNFFYKYVGLKRL